jgi:hypothetical protein
VPDEINHGKLNVAAYVMPTRFPAWPSSGTGGLQFFKAGEPSNAIVACQVVVRTGEWVGVLGACGDSSMMHNSYGLTGTFQSNVLGTATTLQRLLTQTNLVTAPGTGAYSTEDPFEISRAEVYVQGGTQLVGSGTGAVGTTVTLFAISALDHSVAFFNPSTRLCTARTFILAITGHWPRRVSTSTRVMRSSTIGLPFSS